MKRMQCLLLSLSSTFHGSALSYDTGQLRPYTHRPPGVHANPCSMKQAHSAHRFFLSWSSKVEHLLHGDVLERHQRHLQHVEPWLVREREYQYGLHGKGVVLSPEKNNPERAMSKQNFQIPWSGSRALVWCERVFSTASHSRYRLQIWWARLQNETCMRNQHQQKLKNSIFLWGERIQI